MAPTDTTCSDPGNASYFWFVIFLWEVAKPENAALRTGVSSANIAAESKAIKAVLFKRVPGLLKS